MSPRHRPPSEPAIQEHLKARNSIGEWAVTILLFLFATTALAQPFVIPTGSMEDNLLVGDHLLVDKLAYAPAGSAAKHILPYEQPRHGDIIVFRYPGDITQTLIKRLIGLPGDHLKIANGIVFRNGSRLNEPYVFHKSSYEPAHETFPAICCLSVKEPLAEQRQRDMLENHVANGEVIVPPNSFFAMGDNRDDSSDSRFWGFVPRENVIGKPLLIYWSYSAPTEELTGTSVQSVFSHFIDVGGHFFTRTRWGRTFQLVRGFPDSALPRHPIPLNSSVANP
jgi:signal peptidase I